MMLKCGGILLLLVLLMGTCVVAEQDVLNEPQLMPGMPAPPSDHKYHCEGGEGHAPHDHDDVAHKHFDQEDMEQPKFIDGGSSGWMAQDVSQGGMGFVPAEGGGGGVPKQDKDEL